MHYPRKITPSWPTSAFFDPFDALNVGNLIIPSVGLCQSGVMVEGGIMMAAEALDKRLDRFSDFLHHQKKKRLPECSSLCMFPFSIDRRWFGDTLSLRRHLNYAANLIFANNNWMANATPPHLCEDHQNVNLIKPVPDRRHLAILVSLSWFSHQWWQSWLLIHKFEVIQIGLQATIYRLTVSFQAEALRQLHASRHYARLNTGQR